MHDLRATFVTVSLANGKTETWVADRTGHRSGAMINRYRRAARTWAELGLGSLAPLDEAIPESLRVCLKWAATPPETLRPGMRERPRVQTWGPLPPLGAMNFSRRVIRRVKKHQLTQRRARDSNPW